MVHVTNGENVEMRVRGTTENEEVLAQIKIEQIKVSKLGDMEMDGMRDVYSRLETIHETM